uniref:long-chain-fatty-acid--CoA ligase n=1 Tax=Marmota marmota marmota TaxID=9994 RepID=A0A8C5ZZU9_MARMA
MHIYVLQYDILVYWHDFMELGNSIPDTQLDQIIKTQKAHQCAVIIYTSGTVGLPKGVMLSHDNVSAKPLAQALGEVRPWGGEEVVVSYLPLSHIAAQMMDMWVPIKIGAVIYFAESDALKGTLVHTLKEIKPTIFLGVPRIWEKMHDTIKENLVAARARAGQPSLPAHPAPGCPWPPGNATSRWATTWPRRWCTAGSAAPWASSTATPLTESTSEFFLSLDIPIGEIYGLSESSGPHSISTHSDYRILSCGKIVSGCENMLVQQNKDGTGEVCMWGRHIFMGYLDREDTTLETIDEDGWLHSGDLGRMDNQGFLFITGRIKELLITAGGENVAPVPIENLVREKIPIISNAMLVGDRAKFLSILLTLKVRWAPAVSGAPLNKLSLEAINFCRSLGSQADTVTEIVRQQDPLIYEAIQQGIDAVNLEATSEAQRIHKWVILEKDFSIQGGELGPTTKMKRPFIAQKYKTQIENFYQ